MDEKATLAPLHALLDPAYPDNLRMVAEWLYVQLVEDDGLVDPALLALRQTERLSTELGGMNIYMNKGLRYRASLRDRQMFELFNGRNYDELARSNHLSPMRVRQIIGAMMADETARRQGRLDLS
jgi:Mor family transcriptional regulator